APPLCSMRGSAHNGAPMNPITFKGANILITGASSGIGAALARRLAREGATLFLVARRQDRLSALADQLQTAGAKIEIIPADLAPPDSPAQVLAQVLARVESSGGVDILINNAGVGEYGPFADHDLGATLQMISLNIFALVRLTHGVLPHMMARRRGHIVNVAS